MAGTPKPSRRIVTPARGRSGARAAGSAAERLGLVLEPLEERQLVEDVRVVHHAALARREDRHGLDDAGLGRGGRE